MTFVFLIYQYHRCVGNLDIDVLKTLPITSGYIGGPGGGIGGGYGRGSGGNVGGRVLRRFFVRIVRRRRHPWRQRRWRRRRRPAPPLLCSFSSMGALVWNRIFRYYFTAGLSEINYNVRLLRTGCGTLTGTLETILRPIILRAFLEFVEPVGGHNGSTCVIHSASFFPPAVVPYLERL